MERLFHPEKQFTIGREENCLPKTQLVIILFEIDIVAFACKVLCKLYSLKYYFTFVSLLIFIVISIQLLKQIWFLLVRKGSQTKGSSAN